MSNLLPLTAKQNVRYEYWTRVVTVWVLLIAAALFIVGTLRIPSYVFIQAELDVLEESAAEHNQEQQAFLEAKEGLEQADKTAALFLSGYDMPVFSSVYEKIITLAGPGISVTGVTLGRTEEGFELAEISVTGVAQTRAGLAAFREAVVADEQFVDMNLPISNFAKDSDIAFSVTITPTNPADL